jgi:RNA polymerase sigma-70 factor (ECF subfamily)
VAVNRTLNAVRAMRRVSRYEAPLDAERWDADPAALAAAPPPVTDRAATADAIAAAARQLAPGARQVFYLHDVEGYTHEEIAASLGITAGGSKSQLFKARAKLRRLLAPLVDYSATPRPSSVTPSPPAAPAALTLAHAAPRV